MKGISHFSIGVAAASCFPAAVEAGASGNPLYFILGGAFGLLPDTLDFKLTRFVYKHDLEVHVDPLNPDPDGVAEAVARGINTAFETRKPYKIKLNTVRLGTDKWQRYEVFFDVAKRRVVVRYGPVVDTGGTPIEGLEAPDVPEGSASVACDIKLDYLATTTVDIFDGPMFTMKYDEDCKAVIPEFSPWHRNWSHSFVIGLVFSLVAAVLFGPLAGLVGLAAFSGHVLSDQLGFLGSNLWFPFTRERTHGLKLMHSGQSWPNFTAVWSCCLVIFWNLYRVTPSVAPLSPFKLGWYGLALPALVIYLLTRWQRKPTRAGAKA
jgi:hypothetical protein